MNMRKTLFTMTIAGFVALLFCLPGHVFAGGGPNPGVPAGYKLIGPSLKGVLFLGWIPYNDESGEGDIEAVLYLDGKTYYGVYNVPPIGVPEDTFTAYTPYEIAGGNLPCEIVEDYGMGVNTCETGTESAEIWSEKDVSNFQTSWGDDPKLKIINRRGESVYVHALSCEVKVSFLIPK